MTTDGRPRHIGIILGGSRRWAAERRLPPARGHEHSARAARLAIRACLARRVPFVTLYAFSVTSWSRPKEEVDTLMRILAAFAEEERAFLRASGVSVRVIGELDDLPTFARRAMERLIEDTAGESAMTLTLALSYGGRRDMVNAMRALAARVQGGLVLPEEITEESLRSHLTTSEIPDPDLIVRTGGERCLNDFLLFEAAHAELFFTETLWPDFTEATLDEAISAYLGRKRRHGPTSAPEEMIPARAA